MNESVLTYATRWPVALALACGLAIASYQVDARAAPAPGLGHVSGTARVVDGDTLDVAGERIRLEGIDAPEQGQVCARRLAGTWDCGSAAQRELQRLVQGQTVTCEERGRDRYRRLLAVCFVNGEDISRRMVREGLAWAFVKYSQTYVAEEAQARAAGRGVFATANEAPWDYRSGRWANAEQQAPTGCAIKGNVTRNGRIYHMPWSPWYAKVVIDEARGERWFCSEEEATEAGWRPSQGS